MIIDKESYFCIDDQKASILIHGFGWCFPDKRCGTPRYGQWIHITKVIAKNQSFGFYFWKPIHFKERTEAQLLRIFFQKKIFDPDFLYTPICKATTPYGPLYYCKTPTSADASSQLPFTAGKYYVFDKIMEPNQIRPFIENTQQIVISDYTLMDLLSKHNCTHVTYETLHLLIYNFANTNPDEGASLLYTAFPARYLTKNETPVVCLYSPSTKTIYHCLFTLLIPEHNAQIEPEITSMKPIIHSFVRTQTGYSIEQLSFDIPPSSALSHAQDADNYTNLPEFVLSYIKNNLIHHDWLYPNDGSQPHHMFRFPNFYSPKNHLRITHLLTDYSTRQLQTATAFIIEANRQATAELITRWSILSAWTPMHTVLKSAFPSHTLNVKDPPVITALIRNNIIASYHWKNIRYFEPTTTKLPLATIYPILRDYSRNELEAACQFIQQTNLQAEKKINAGLKNHQIDLEEIFSKP